MITWISEASYAGRLRVALEVQYKSVLAYAAAVEQFKWWQGSSIEETSMKLETLANFLHAAQKYSLAVPCAELVLRICDYICDFLFLILSEFWIFIVIFCSLSDYHNVKKMLSSIEAKLALSMEFEALSPDNSMALFYSYLLLTETKIAEGGISTGERKTDIFLLY